MGNILKVHIYFYKTFKKIKGKRTLKGATEMKRGRGAFALGSSDITPGCAGWAGTRVAGSWFMTVWKSAVADGGFLEVSA